MPVCVMPVCVMTICVMPVCVMSTFAWCLVALCWLSVIPTCLMPLLKLCLFVSCPFCILPSCGLDLCLMPCCVMSRIALCLFEEVGKSCVSLMSQTSIIILRLTSSGRSSSSFAICCYSEFRAYCVGAVRYKTAPTQFILVFVISTFTPIVFQYNYHLL